MRFPLLLQLESLRTSAEEEFRRRLGLERTLHEAASLFRRELSDKSAEMHRLQGQVRRMRRLSASAVTGCATAPLQQQQLSPSAAGPCSSTPLSSTNGCFMLQPGSAGSPGKVTINGVAAAEAAPFMAHSPAAMPCNGCTPACSPAAGCHLGCELAALRAARNDYACAVLEQDRIRNSLLSSLGDKLRTVSSDTTICFWKQLWSLTYWRLLGDNEKRNIKGDSFSHDSNTVVNWQPRVETMATCSN